MTDTPQLLLAHHLKALKLPTFLREYDKLARQCAAEGLDHIRFLLRLARISHTNRRIGATNQRKLLCSNDFLQISGEPRCRQNVAQNHLILEALKAAVWKLPSMPAW